MNPITVFSARKILTMNPTQPEATHVAVRDGRVLAVGDLDRMQAWGEFTLDERAKFSDGKPVTPEDVIFTFDLLAEKGYPRYAVTKNKSFN